MKNQSTFLVCNLDRYTDKEACGVLTSESHSAPLYNEVCRLVNYYISEQRRLSVLCQGQGIATIRDSRILREWRHVDEVVRLLAFNKIAELPIEEQFLWFAMLYRAQLQVCFVLNEQATVDQLILPGFRPVIDDVRRRRGRIVSLVDQDPARDHVKAVLRFARKGARFSLRPHSTGPRLQGLTLIDWSSPLVDHPLVRRHLSVE